MHNPHLLFSILTTTTMACAAILPLPPGPNNVTLTTGPLVDHSRLDPYAPTPEPRALMVSVFQPASCDATVAVDYMPPVTAEYDTQALASQGWPADESFTDLQLPLCPGGEGTRVDEDAPVVLFSPGLGAPRQLYNAMAAAVSSHGFTVVAMDHTYEAPVVQFPTTLVYQNATALALDTGNGSSTPAIISNLDVRVQDASFILSTLSSPTTVGALLPARGPKPFDTSCAAMFGHSFGGATAAQLAASDTRLRGAVNMDGTLYGNVTDTGFSAPFLLFGHENATSDASWVEVWPRITGFKRELEVEGTTHLSFTDAALDLGVLGVDTEGAPYDGVVGTIEGKRAVDVVTAYLVAFLEMVLKGEKGGLLDAESEEYPEVSFVEP